MCLCLFSPETGKWLETCRVPKTMAPQLASLTLQQRLWFPSCFLYSLLQSLLCLLQYLNIHMDLDIDTNMDTDGRCKLVLELLAAVLW